MTRHKEHFLVVCHDAGGAELISAYVKVHQKTNLFFCYVAGPAKKIFKRKGIPFTALKKNSSIKKILNGATTFSTLLAGSGWGSHLERSCTIAAKQAGIKTVVYLDHWVEYRERFGYPHARWRDALPDELWVGDTFARTLARSYFDIPIKLVPNLFVKEIIADYKKKRRGLNVSRTILFIDEPISRTLNIYNDKGRPPVGEKDVVQTLLQLLNTNDRYETVILRFHPVEDPNKYDHIIDTYAGKIKVIKSVNRMINDDLAHAGTVIGMSSMALTLSFLCGIKTISVMPRPLPPCRLPYDMLKLRRLNDVKKELF